MKVVKKAEEFDAVQWFRMGDHPAVHLWTGRGNAQVSRGRAFIDTDRGRMDVRPSDWIITGEDGKSYPVPNMLYRKLYVEVAT